MSTLHRFVEKLKEALPEILGYTFLLSMFLYIATH